MSAERWGEILNWTLTIILIAVIVLALQQRYFEERKCNKWAKERIFNIRTNNPEVDYFCSMECNTSLGTSIVASSTQQNLAGDEIPAKFTLYGNQTINVWENERK